MQLLGGRSRRVIGTTTALLAAAGIMTALATPAADAATACRSVSLPVSMGLAGLGTVSGTECVPADPTGAFQLLINGATYNRHYWDGEGVAAFSYQAVANAAGTTTLAIDPIGAGQSTHPLAGLITGMEQANVFHQVIGDIRFGRVDGTRYTDVIAVGHSVGSLTLAIEASLYPHDLTGLVLTGYSHLPSATGVASIIASDVTPASDLGYLTLKPGTRAAAFHSADVDPAVVAGDEAHADEIPAAQLTDAIPVGISPTTALLIHTPVLEVDGGQDQIFCGPLTPGCPTSAALYDHEHTLFAGPMAALVLPAAGHDVTLAADSAPVDARIQDWTASVRAGAPLTGPLS